MSCPQLSTQFPVFKAFNKDGPLSRQTPRTFEHFTPQESTHCPLGVKAYLLELTVFTHSKVSR